MAGLVGQVQHWTACASRSVGLRHCHKVNYVFSMCSFYTILCSPDIRHRVIPSCHCIIEVFVLPLQHRKESSMLEDEPSSHGVRFATLTWQVLEPRFCSCTSVCVLSHLLIYQVLLTPSRFPQYMYICMDVYILYEGVWGVVPLMQVPC